MGKIETVCEILRDLGLEPEVVDGEIRVRYEMKYISIHIKDDTEDDNDEDKNSRDQYVNVSYAAYYGVKDDEVADVLVVCNKANRELRQLKTFVSEDLSYVSSSFEFWYLDNDDLRNSIKYALFMISHVRSWFFRELRRVQGETQPTSESAGTTEEDG